MGAPWYLAMLAEGFRKLGRHDDALGALRAGIAFAGQQHCYDAELHRLRAEILVDTEGFATRDLKDANALLDALARANSVSPGVPGRPAELTRMTRLADTPYTMARAYPVHEAKAKLSELLRRVKRGRTVTISEHGREIARVTPIPATPDLRSRLERLKRDGVVVPAGGAVAGVRPLLRKRGALRRFLSARE